MLLAKMSDGLEKDNAGVDILIIFWKDGTKITISVYKE